VKCLNCFFLYYKIKYQVYFLSQILLLLFWIVWIILALSWLPIAAAQKSPSPKPFPNPTFQAFSDFILSNFHSQISLTTTLLILFSLVNNPELLNLHARQTHPVFPDENLTRASGWMKTLARGLGDRLNYDLSTVLTQYTDKNWVTQLAKQLDSTTVFLGLSPYKYNGNFTRKISCISQESIAPIRLICPPNMTCTTSTCQLYHISLRTRLRDIPQVTLIEGSTVLNQVYVLSGECTRCKTHYHADHESYTPSNTTQSREVFINSARYLKIGSSLWVDRVFSNALLSGMYNFHASANAYTQFWNDSFGAVSIPCKLSRRQIWQAFVQESIRSIAQMSKIDFEANQNIAIDNVCNSLNKFG